VNQPPEYQLWSPEAQYAFDERIAILSEGGPITEVMITIAVTEALEIESQIFKP
jgi:hypothetical protein